jgi:hypothetical protein
MKKLMNAADAFVEEILDGSVRARPTRVGEARVVRAAYVSKRGKIGIGPGGIAARTAIQSQGTNGASQWF